jgi:hypothetical protein
MRPPSRYSPENSVVCDAMITDIYANAILPYQIAVSPIALQLSGGGDAGIDVGTAATDLVDH